MKTIIDHNINRLDSNFLKSTKVKEKASELEALLAGNLLNTMFEKIKFDPFSKKDSLFKSLLVNKYAEYIAPKLRLAENIENRLTSLQEIENE